MKKASMACLIAGALALPLGAHAQSGDDGAGSNDGKMNTTNPNVGKDSRHTDSSAPASRTTGSSSNASSSRSAGTTASDAAITAKVKTQLIKDRDVSAMNVNVDTDNGVVTLKGNAKSRTEADKAASLARSVDGVKSVKNELVVGAASGSNTSRGSSTGAANTSRGSSSGADNARHSLDNKSTPPRENRERSNAERTD